jgi:transposase
VVTLTIPQRVGRGSFVCKECDTIANADMSGVENIRQTVLPNLARDGSDKDTGWVAQPVIQLFDRSEGCFSPQG